jgi:hypothetical protein
MQVIEVDGVNTVPVETDAVQIFAGTQGREKS